MTSKKKTRKKLVATDPDKYNLGSFVTNNQQKLTNAGLLAGGLLGDNAAGDFLTGASSGFGTGAAIGSVVPGIGTAIGGVAGGVIGAIGGLFGGNKRRKRQQEAARQQELIRKTDAINAYQADVDTINQDPMGVFADGGTVSKNPIKRNRKRINSSKKQASNMLRNADGDTLLENVVEFLDPTGISSWDDIYRSIGDNQSGSTTMEIMGALPLVGKVGKLAKGTKLSPAGKLLLNAPIAGRVIDGVSDAKNLTTEYADGGQVKKSPVTPNQSFNNAKSLYDPLYNKLIKAYGAKDYNELINNPNIDKTVKQGLDNAFGYSMDDFDNGNRVVPAMSPSMKKLQETVLKMPDNEVRDLLKQNYDNVNIFNFKSRLPKGVSAMNALGLYKEFNNLKKEGYTFANGGDIMEPNQINIEAGEIQIDPSTGKILREFKGINPETGGMYEPHAKGKKKDSENNIVTAQEGTFIITKAKAKEYKDSIDNNDKLRQESIMQNIRNNKKRNGFKFATGGRVDPLTDSIFSPTPQYASPVNTLTVPDLATPPIVAPPNQRGFNFGNALDTAIDIAPGLINIFQGSKAPDYQSRIAMPGNRYRSQALSNMPQEISFAPLQNELMRQQRGSINRINQTTSSNAIARANIGNLEANVRNQTGKLYLDNQIANNQIRGQRSNIYNQLDQQDASNYFNTNQFNTRIDETNRLMDAARRQQRNTGFSQLQEVYRNNQRNKQLQSMDQFRASLLPEMFYGASPQINEWLKRLQQGG